MITTATEPPHTRTQAGTQTTRLHLQVLYVNMRVTLSRGLQDHAGPMDDITNFASRWARLSTSFNENDKTNARIRGEDGATKHSGSAAAAVRS